MGKRQGYIKMKIEIKTLPHKKQSYDTCGDWKFEHGRLRKILVSDMHNRVYEFLVAIHEFIEAFLCEQRHISARAVNKFDIQYEYARERGIASLCGCVPTGTSEPGFDRHAPYHKEHAFATKVERMLAFILHVDWRQYDETVNKLSQ